MLKKRPAHEPHNLARMVWGGADSIATDLLLMLDKRHTCWEPILDETPALDLISYTAFNVSLALRQFGNFDRRIRKVMQSDPLRLLWLAQAPANSPRPKRRALCNGILNSDEGTLHITTLKLKIVFLEELQSCAVGDGKLSMVLWAPLRLIALKFTGTSQAMEGINSLVKSACKRCPNISLPLLDARIGVKRALALGEREHADAKWSAVQQRATAVLDSACDCLAGIDTVMPVDRFAKTPPTIGLQAADVAAIQGARLWSTSQLQWAASYSLLLWRCLKEMGGKSTANRFGLLVHREGVEDTVWICTHVHSCTCYFIKCSVVRDGAGGESFPFQVPAEIASVDTASSTDIFGHYYDLCTADGKMSVPIDMCKMMSGCH